MNAARETVLSRLRAALADSPSAPEVSRAFRHSPADVDLFVDRLEDYKATVHSGAIDFAGVSTLLVPHDAPAEWLTGFEGMVIVDDGLSFDEIEGVDAVLTGCAIAIADTGTIVLDCGVAQGRRVISLLPDRHIIVVRRDQIVGGVPEALRLLDPRRPQTWISGPSATSDIELKRVEGVHGPRRLEVVITSL